MALDPLLAGFPELSQSSTLDVQDPLEPSSLGLYIRPRCHLRSMRPDEEAEHKEVGVRWLVAAHEEGRIRLRVFSDPGRQRGRERSKCVEEGLDVFLPVVRHSDLLEGLTPLGGAFPRSAKVLASALVEQTFGDVAQPDCHSLEPDLGEKALNSDGQRESRFRREYLTIGGERLVEVESDGEGLDRRSATYAVVA